MRLAGSHLVARVIQERHRQPRLEARWVAGPRNERRRTHPNVGLASPGSRRILLAVPSSVSPRPRPASDAPCPCGGGKTFGACCKPLLEEVERAATAGQLMRSRFTAHVVGDYRHLHRTYLGTARQPYAEPTGEPDVDWTRLVIHQEEPGTRPGTAFVDFSAYYDAEGREGALHEKAEFAQVDGHWIYTRAVREGPAPIKSTAPKVGRNDPCPCGSERKFKHCCGR